MVREHLTSILGAGGVPANSYSNVLIRMSKMQAAQVFAASLMFGYFLRRADHRFQLERQLGAWDSNISPSVFDLLSPVRSASAARRPAWS